MFDILSRLQAAEKAYTVKHAENKLLEKQFAAAEERKTTAENTLEVFEKVTILLQKTSEFARQQAKTRIEEIVSSALNAVFDDLYSFRIEIVVRAGRVEADYFLAKNGLEAQMKPPDYDRGGGVVDVVTIALRLAIVELVGCQGPVLLDEIGKMVSVGYRQPVAEFLKTYSEQFNRQIILITHAAELAEVADKSFCVTQKNGVSQVN